MIRWLVTDRRRLCPEAASEAEAARCLLEQAQRACDAGVDAIQLRERDLEAAALADLAAALVDVARGSATRILVNDRLDVALVSGAGGVHLRADSISVAAARRLAPAGFVVSRSVHSAAEAGAAGDADYLIAGTVFATPSKPGATGLLGVEGLRRIVQASRVPVLAIGGVTNARIGKIAEAGAAGFAAIGLFIDTVRSAS